MSGKHTRPPTLGELVRQVTKIATPRPSPKSSDTESKDGGIASPRDERGLPYHGDFPNPASDRTRGCF
jgi:hypothetical protein